MSNVIIHYSAKLNRREWFLLKTFEILNPLHGIIHRHRKPWGKSVDELRSQPQNTLAYQLGNFLFENKLQPVPKAEKHDAYHVLLGYGTDIKEEAGMQFFLLGNGKRSPFTIGTSMLAAAVLPERFGYFYQQFKRGIHSHSMANWNFEALLHDDYNSLVQKIATKY